MERDCEVGPSDGLGEGGRRMRRRVLHDGVSKVGSQLDFVGSFKSYNNDL